MDVPELVDSGRDDLWIVLPHLGAGGAQKVALIAAHHFAVQGLKVKLVTLIPKLSIVALQIGMFLGFICSSSKGGYLMLCTYLSMLSPQYGSGGPASQFSEFGHFPEHLDP